MVIDRSVIGIISLSSNPSAEFKVQIMNSSSYYLLVCIRYV